MKKLFKTTVVCLLCLSIMLLIASCSQSTDSADGKSSPSASAGDSKTTAPSENNEDLGVKEEKEFYTITMYSALHPSYSLEKIPESGYYLDNLYEEKFNVDFDIQYVPATNEDEVYNITMASGDIPDIMTGNWDRLHKYSEAWWSLNDFIKGKYENLEKYFLDDPYVYALSAEQDGQIKILNMLSEQYIGDTLLARGDLAEQWGIDFSSIKTKAAVVRRELQAGRAPASLALKQKKIGMMS